MTREIVLAAVQKNPTEFADAVKVELTQRAVAAVDAMRPAVAGSLFNGAAPAVEVPGDE